MDKIDKRKRPYREPYWCKRPDCTIQEQHRPHPSKIMPVLILPGSPITRY